MKKLIQWLENDFAPKMNTINHNVWVVTLKNSVMQVLPFIFLGSLFCVLTIPGSAFGWDWWPNFWTLFGWTMGMISLFVAFLIPFNLMEKIRLRKQRIIAGLSGIITFLIIIKPQMVADQAIGFSHSAVGAGGMFVAIVAGVFVGAVMSAFGKFSFFKEESVIPDFVRAWFDSMLPIGIIISIAWIVIDLIGIDVYHLVVALFMPLSKIIETPYGFALTMLCYTFLYSMGISAWVLTPVITPVILGAIAANIDGTAINLVTGPTIYSVYLWVGGIGCTLPLVFMYMKSKSQRLRALGKACLVPSIFNINEPIVFGSIVWNPTMMIPFWMIGIILPLVTWFFTKTIHFAPIPNILYTLWYTPFPIGTWVVTRSIRALMLVALNTTIASVIWYPFFKAYEKQELEKESK
jgi:PTS system cellobiose-specific IIC component